LKRQNFSFNLSRTVTQAAFAGDYSVLTDGHNRGSKAQGRKLEKAQTLDINISTSQVEYCTSLKHSIPWTELVKATARELLRYWKDGHNHLTAKVFSLVLVCFLLAVYLCLFLLYSASCGAPLHGCAGSLKMSRACLTPSSMGSGKSHLPVIGKTRAGIINCILSLVCLTSLVLSFLILLVANFSKLSSPCISRVSYHSQKVITSRDEFTRISDDNSQQSTKLLYISAPFTTLYMSNISTECSSS
jgi:hypothetical protein